MKTISKNLESIIFDPFHDCGSVVILRKSSSKVISPFCPTCGIFLNFNDYPHLMVKQHQIDHTPDEFLRISDVPFLLKNNCSHPKSILIKNAENMKTIIYQCLDCGSLIRERQ